MNSVSVSGRLCFCQARWLLGESGRLLSRIVADNLISIGGDKPLNRHKAYDALV